MPENENRKPPKVFISYSHDTPAHKQWVAEFASRLVKNGIDVIFDQWDLGPGDDIPKFMERGVSESDRVLMICTDQYVKKADDGKGGVGYEAMIVTGELVRDLGTSKFIPVIRQAERSALLPRSVSTRFYVNLSEDQNYDEQLELLLRELHEVPANRKPPLGKNPFAQQPSGTETPSTIEAPPFEEASFPEKPSTFLKPNEAFAIISDIHGRETPVYLPNVEHIFLRIIPTTIVPPIKSSKEAIDLVQRGGLTAMGYRGYGVTAHHERNKYGGSICHYDDKDKVINLTQLFLSKQLWGIDASSIEKESHKEFAKVDFGYFPSLALEEVFNKTLANYVKFASGTLKLSPPLKFIAGATDVEGYRMAMPGQFPAFSGRVVDKNIVFEGMIDDYNKKTTEILRPFFNDLWEECGLERPNVEILK